VSGRTLSGNANWLSQGYDKAEVAAGGANTDELSNKTMESQKVSGLFFIGEVVDVTGHLGGHNFQWAWALGRCGSWRLMNAKGIRVRSQ
jgi:predicted flavoprotein YhiN